MLDFFRRYQRYFFLVITIVIIISFSFFGTYSTLGSNTWREQIAFKAINGKEIARSEVDEIASFLATDNEDKMLHGGIWGPNFLNDGVIRKDFLETGLAQELAHVYQNDLKEDLNKRLAKEKKYSLYSHPQAPFVNVENIWNYFSPQMTQDFQILQAASDGLDRDAFNSRVKLFLAEKQLPASTLRYILNYQQKQYSWLKPDDRLDRLDLSLFGYHTLEDWFGSHFTRLISEFIINTAILAEEQGYKVSKAEALTDLIRHTQISYQQNQNNPSLGVASLEEYFNEQLRRLNIDQARAVKIWRQVLLFRRYFQDAGANALVDTLPNQTFHDFAHENVTLDLYRLPAPLHLSNNDELQKLEVYLHAVAKQNKLDPLDLPQQFLSVADVAQKYPELVQKRYVLAIAQVNQKALQARIGLRELWQWEVDDQNWQILVQQFPILGVKFGKTREERFETLDSLESTLRSRIDAFAKQAIVRAHPEWIEKALNDAKPEKKIVGLRVQGGKMPFDGLDAKEQRQKLIRLLDEAPLGENVPSDSSLYNFSADDQAYYRISVLERADSQEILTFSEAKSDETLDKIRDRILEKYYEAIRGKDAFLYQDEKKEWKPFRDVRDTVADQYFEKVMQALESTRRSFLDKEDMKFLHKDRLAHLRLYPYFSKIKEDLQKDPIQATDRWVKKTIKEEELTSLADQPPLSDQWKIEKITLTLDRQTSENVVDAKEALTLNLNTWSSIKTPANGELIFYQVKDHKPTELSSTHIAEQVRKTQILLGAETQRHLMRQILVELKAHHAISLAYMNSLSEESSSQDSKTQEQ